MVHAFIGGLRLADAGVTTEPRGLTSTQARPADMFTVAAVPGRRAALDVCVASSNAAAAAGDAAEGAFRRKLRRYRREIPELGRAGISYRPLVWTASGRPHPAVSRTMRFAADLAANRSERHADSAAFLSRWRHEVQVALLRRRAAMMRAVMPQPSPQSDWLLTGFVQGPPDAVHRAPLVEDGDCDAEAAEDEQDAGDVTSDDDEELAAVCW